DDGAVAEAEGDGGDLDVDLLHGPAQAPQLGRQPPEFRCGSLVVRPHGQRREGDAEPLEVAVTSRAQLDPEVQLAEDGNTDADAVAASDFVSGAAEDVTPAVDVIARGAGIEEEAFHSKRPSARRARSSALAISSSLRAFRAA